MKIGIVLVGLFVFLLISFAAISMLNPGDLNAQVQQKVLQQKRVLPVLRPSVVSVTPQKAVLTQGGDAVVVQATGTNLGVVNSVQVIRAGNAVAEIEATLDKSLLPGTLKVSLKASSTALIASDYQLAVFDAGNTKLLDVPTTVLAIEVVAPVQKAAVAQKVATPIKATEPVQRQVQTAPITAMVKPGVTSVTPQKAVLTRGGEAVVVEAKGTNLTGVGSVQVTRSGSEAQGIEETLDKSQLPNTLKVSLKASSEAPAANDYQLSVFDANKQKLLDVPTTVLAIEVTAPGTKTFAAPMARKPRQQAPLTRDQMAVTRPDVASVTPQKAVLIQGGDPVVVEAKGDKLDMVALVRVMRAGTPVPEIEASVDRSQLPALLKVSLKASTQAQVGSGYQLAVFDTNRRKILDVPSTALAIEVAAPARTSPSIQRPTKVGDKRVRSAQPLEKGPELQITAKPYISDWTRSPQHTDSEIKFFGRDIFAEQFTATIGSRGLNITYRTPTEIRATLPSLPMTGDLIVGHNTSMSQYVLQSNYKVFGDPLITAVSPQTFSYGDLITMSGSSLDRIRPREWSDSGSDPLNRKYIKICDTYDPFGQTDERLLVQGYNTSADGTTATFQAREIYAAKMTDEGVGFYEISPQPYRRVGKLRFDAPAGTEWRWSVASPNSVTYVSRVNELVITKTYCLRGNDETDWAILNGSMNRVYLQGRGLYPGTSVKMGAVDITGHSFLSGTEAFFNLPGNVETNPITLSRDGLVATSSVIKAIPEPKFQPSTVEFLRLEEPSKPVEIVLNTTYRLEGWYLTVPSGVEGLTYEFRLDPFNEPNAPTGGIKFNLLNHTNNLIEFRVEFEGELPAGYENWALFKGAGYYNLFFAAKFGGVSWTFINKPYVLKVQ